MAQTKKRELIRGLLEADLRFNGCAQTAGHVLDKFDAVYDDHADAIAGMPPAKLAEALVNSASAFGGKEHPFLRRIR